MKRDLLRGGLETAFIDSACNSNLAYRPQFLSNDYRVGRKVIATIESELKKCDSFIISVAFITDNGIEPLMMTLKELENKGIPGKILTTDYLCFSEPKALKRLNALTNIELRFYESGASEGFHTKGYIFQREGLYTIIVGSSNLTGKALSVNKEWNTKLIVTEQGKYREEIIAEFDSLWNAPKTKSFEDFIDNYQIRYEEKKKQESIVKAQSIPSIEDYKLTPNSMQVSFIKKLEEFRKQNENKALLISATGTGKTYASAFALRRMGFGRALFVVHREQIAKQAMESFTKVFGKNRSFGLLSGNSKELEKDFVFATVQMLSKPEVMKQFAQNTFDCIVIDETHHAGAESYKRIMEYFTPELWIGMTASPDTNNYDIYSIFDHNIACEIRLQNAMEEDLLCPFHYFGITELEIDGEIIDDKSSAESFRLLTSDARVDNVIKQAQYYGFSGDRVKGLMFCSRKDEAKLLSEKFNSRGLRTAVLTGEDSIEEREKVIERLINDNPVNASEQLDYILSVDIFSEGVDVPQINQVIMLRPTKSPVVFIQQLGRGLRKAKDKEYVVILDFIGNYMNNFMIPIALSGDRTYNKDNVRRYLMEGERVIPGISTIHFDEISKKRIYESIDTANFSDIKLIKENYKNLKYKLGRIPTLKDFDDYGEMDVLRIFENAGLGSYYKFLSKYEKEYTIKLSSDEELVIEFISKKFANGKRVHELQFLKRMLMYARGFVGTGLLDDFSRDLKTNYGKALDANQRENIVNVFTNKFASGSSANTYDKCLFIESKAGEYIINPSFSKMLSNKIFYDMVEELVEFGIARYERDYSKSYKDKDFVLYQKYTYEDVCRLLNWEKNEVPLNIGGYKFDKKTKTFPVFINYNKEENISDTIKYEDRFIDNKSIITISKSGRTQSSDDVMNFLHAKERGIAVDLFVRKNKDDKCSKEFYYLGSMTASGKAQEFIMPNTNKTAVEMEFVLDEPVREDLYEYIVNG